MIRNGLVSAEPEAGLSYEYELGKTFGGEYSVRYLALEHTAQESILVLQDDKMNSLKSLIPSDGFDLLQFFKLAAEISSAIEDIHEKGVIHKDINPSNIIVNPTLDTVKLIDYGLAE